MRSRQPGQLLPDRGEAHDLVGADHLLPSMQDDTLIADEAFDADERVIAPLAAAGKTAVIPPKANRRLPRDYDQYIYQARHLIENFFAKLKQFRAIATRAQLPRRHPPDRRAYLAQLRTGPRWGHRKINGLVNGAKIDRQVFCAAWSRWRVTPFILFAWQSLQSVRGLG